MRGNADARSMAIAGDVMAVSGGIATGVGLLLLLLHDDEEQQPQGVEVAALTPDTVGVRIAF